MSLYGHNSRKFQPRPTLAIVMIVALCQFLLALQLSALVLHALDTSLAWTSGWEKVLVIHAPFADDFMSPFFVSPPLEPTYRLAVPIVSGSGLILAILLVAFWPTGSSLATRHFVHVFALALGAWGAVPTALRVDGFEGAAAWSGAPLIVWPILFGVAGLLVVIDVERRAIGLLGNLFDVERRSVRATLWLCRIPIPGLIAAGLAYLNDFEAGCWALVIAVVVTGIDDAFHRPRPAWEPLARPEMRSGAILALVAAGIVVGGSIAAFGVEAFDQDLRVVEISRDRGFEFETKAELLRKQLRDPVSLEKQRDIIRFRGQEREVGSESER